MRVHSGKTGIKAFDIYGLSEIVRTGHGLRMRASERHSHLRRSLLPEIVDPETLEPLPDGKEGELVITTLNKRAMPIIRYRARPPRPLKRTAAPADALPPYPPHRSAHGCLCSSSAA